MNKLKLPESDSAVVNLWILSPKRPLFKITCNILGGERDKLQGTYGENSDQTERIFRLNWGFLLCEINVIRLFL